MWFCRFAISIWTAFLSEPSTAITLGCSGCLGRIPRKSFKTVRCSTIGGRRTEGIVYLAVSLIELAIVGAGTDVAVEMAAEVAAEGVPEVVAELAACLGSMARYGGPSDSGLGSEAGSIAELLEKQKTFSFYGQQD